MIKLPRPVKSDAVEEIEEPWIGANRIKEWKHL